jgi:hypothetical protein
MSESLRYITNDRGERVGVLLDVEEYRRLVSPTERDRELLVGLSQAELDALAHSALAPVEQARLDDLLARHADSQLTAEELAEVDRFLEQIDQLTLLKTRARYTLACQHEPASVG